MSCPAGTRAANQEAPRITRFGKPVAEVVPATPKAGQGAWIGSMKDTMQILGDIVAPVIDETDIKALRE